METKRGTKISHRAVINGASNITISDNCTISHGCILNGSASDSEGPSIVLGRYVLLCEDCVIDPPKAAGGNKVEFLLGNYSTIGERTTVRLSSIGNRVYVGADCKLGELSIINDCCIIENGATIPARSIILPYMRVQGIPGKGFVQEEISSAYRKVLEIESHLRSLI